MREGLKTGPKKRRYKVSFRRKGEPKVKHIDFIWATSAREAKQIIRARQKDDEKFRRVRAGALR